MYKINELSKICEHLNERENNAAKAQRESIKYKQCEYLSDKVGDEFEAIIANITEFGIFAELEENGCEGLLSKKYLESENMLLNLEKYTLENSKTGEKYTLGDKIKIVISRVDIMKRQIDFNLKS
jgi:ribonuclease R